MEMNFWVNLLLNILSVIILTTIGLLSLTYDSIKGSFTTIGWIFLIVGATLYILTTISDKVKQKKSESIYADDNKNIRKQLSNIISILLNSYNSELKEKAIQGYKESVNEEMTVLKFESK
jgi:tryptophan-rich sensory protein